MAFRGRADQGSKQSPGGNPFFALTTIVFATPDAFRNSLTRARLFDDVIELMELFT